MFGIFGGGIPSARSLLSPVNFATNYMAPLKPATPALPVNYATPRSSVSGASLFAPGVLDNLKYTLNVKTPIGTINPNLVNRVSTPITSPTQNQFNWGGPAPVIPQTVPKMNFNWIPMNKVFK